jgi:hypothetical protein
MAWMASQRISVPRQGSGSQPTTKESAVIKTSWQTLCAYMKEAPIHDPNGGTRVVLHDQFKSQAWVLVTHGGAYTEVHHDAEGAATFMVMTCGAKVWVPCEPNLDGWDHTRADLHARMERFALEECEKPEKHTGGSVLLEAGDVL